MKKRKKKYKDFFKESAKVMSAESVERADTRSKAVIQFLQLAEARKSMGLRQSDLKGFSQADVSKLEKRTDIKLSTLIEYLQSLGMELEIKARPVGRRSKKDEITLLRWAD